MNISSDKLLDAMYRLLHSYASGNWHRCHLLQIMTDQIVSFTESKYGYMDKVIYEKEQFSRQVLLALSTSVYNVVDKETIEKYNVTYDNILEGKIVFTNTSYDKIYNKAVFDKKPHWVNDVPTRLKGDTHCPFFPLGKMMVSYLCYPMVFNEKVIGTLGMADRKGGYSQSLVDRLKPLIDTYTCIEASWRYEMQALEHQKSIVVAKDMFLASMSHEIRTPLNGILGMAEIMRDTKLDQSQKNLLDILRSCSEQLLNLIDDILDFAKISSNRISLRPTCVSIRKFIEELMMYVSKKAQDKNLQLEYDVSEDVPSYVNVDQYRLRQILLNLLTNSIKYTKQGTVILQVRYDNKNTKFTVKDTGVGIPEDKVDSIFEVFTQIESNCQNQVEGVGLGLPIIKGLVELMKGKIEVDSKVNIGTSITIILSLPIEKRSKKRVQKSRNVKHRVLAIDDKKTNREILRHLFEKIGWDSYICSSVDEARPYIERGDIDLFIFDIEMPNISGIDLAKELREEDNKVPIVALSSDFGIDRPNLFDAQLLKPINSQQLKKICLNILEPKHKKVRSEKIYYTSILIVEDNNVNRSVIEMMLHNLGYGILKTVPNGRECLEILKKERKIDVLLLDIKMPVMNGIETLKKIRESSSVYQQPYIIMLTASVLDSDREICQTLGVRDYLLKPVTKRNLRLSIGKARRYLKKM